RRAADLDLVGALAREGRELPAPGADQQRDVGALDRVLTRVIGAQPENLAVEREALAAEQLVDDRHRLAERRQRPAVRDAERVEPRAARQAEIGAPARGRVE